MAEIDDFPDWAIKKNSPKPKSAVEDFPDWAIQKESKKSVEDFPDWAIQKESNSSSNLYKAPKSFFKKSKKDYNDYTTEEIYQYRKKWLLKAGYSEWLDYDSSESLVYQLYDQLRYIEKTHGKILSPKDFKESTFFIREFEESEKINEFAVYLENSFENNIFPLDLPFDFVIPDKKDFNFPKYALSDKFDLNFIVYDIETADDDQTPVSIGIFNLLAKRIVLGLYNPDLKQSKIQTFSHNIIFIETPNLFEALLIADVETVISAISESALQEGQNNLISIFDHSKFNLHKNIKINSELLTKILNGVPQTRSLWIAHNSIFDINMINHTIKEAKKLISSFPQFKHSKVSLFMGEPIAEDLEIKDKNTQKEDAYVINLGNKAEAGFRYKFQFNSKLGAKGTPVCNIWPLQTGTKGYVFALDTLVLSNSLQNPSNSLSYISKGTQWEKKESDYIFPREEFLLNESSKTITDGQGYLFYDLFSTLAGFEQLAKELNYPELGKLLNITFPFTIRPKVCSTLSTASIAKTVMFPYLEMKTGLSKTQIENNILKQRLYQKNFETVYNGGRTEAFTHGIFRQILDQVVQKFIKYLDFESLYPTIARIVYAEKQYILASSNKLAKYYNQDVNLTQQKFWETVETNIDCIRKSKLIPDNIFKHLLGTVQVKISKEFKLLFRGTKLTKTGKKDGKKDEYLTGKIHKHLIQLLTAVTREIIENKTDINRLKDAIKFQKVQRFIFNEDPASFGDEFFTKILILRREKKNEIMEDGSKGNPIEKMLKYVMNSSYGISGEGISREDKIVGKLFIPSIFSSITAGAEYLTSMAEISLRHWGAIPLYSDTDSLITLTSLEVEDKVTSMFWNDQTGLGISKLKNEDDYGEILAIYVAKKKKYYLLSKKINRKKLPFIEVDAENDICLTGKTHGKVQYPNEQFKDAVFHTAKDILYNNKNMREAIRQNKQKFPLLMSISYKSDQAPIFKGIYSFFAKNVNYNITRKKEKFSYQYPQPSTLVSSFTFKLHEHSKEYRINVFFNHLKHEFLFTNKSKKLIKANFGLYGNFGSCKIFVTFPFKKDEYYQFEESLISHIANFFSKINSQELFYKIAIDQAKSITKFYNSQNELYTQNMVHYFVKRNEKGEALEDDLSQRQLYHRIKEQLKKNRLFNYSHQVFDELRTKTKYFSDSKLFIDLNYFVPKSHKLPTISTKEENLIQFADDVILPLLQGEHPPLEDLPNKYFRYITQIGFNVYTNSQINRMTDNFEKTDARQHNSHQFDKLMQELRDASDSVTSISNQDQYALVDYYFNTDIENYIIQRDAFDSEDDRFEAEKEDFQLHFDVTKSIGFHHFSQLLKKIQIDLKNFKDKNHAEESMINIFDYDLDSFNRVIESKTDDYKILVPIPTVIEREDEDLISYEGLKTLKLTDGFNYFFSVLLNDLTFSTRILADQNKLISQNIENLSRIGSYIYYITHDKPDMASKVWGTRTLNNIIPKVKSSIKLPLKFRKLLPHKNLDDRYQREFLYKDMQMFFSDSELLKMSKSHIIKRNKAKYDILDTDKFLKQYFTILEKSWVIFSDYDDFEMPNRNKLFPKIIKKNFLSNEWALELTPYKSIEYQATLSIKVVAGFKRKFEAQMFINPQSRNLKNFELFETTIEKLDEDSWIIADLIKDLWTYKELSLFEREASLTLEDMLDKKKSNYQYLQKILYLTLTHNMIKDNIQFGSSNLYFFSHAGNINIKDSVKFVSENNHFRSEIEKQLRLSLSPTIINNKETFKKYVDQKISFITQRANYEAEKGTFTRGIVDAIQEAYKKEVRQYDYADQLQIRRKVLSVTSHRSNYGISINHFGKGWGRFNANIYAKNEDWFINKVMRTHGARDIDFNDTQIADLTSKNDYYTIRFETGFWGFEPIHDSALHNITPKLESFITGYIIDWMLNQTVFENYTNFVNETIKKVPIELYTPSWNKTFDQTIKKKFEPYDTGQPPDLNDTLLDIV